MNTVDGPQARPRKMNQGNSKLFYCNKWPKIDEEQTEDI